jgi:diaminopimelate epimerase
MHFVKMHGIANDYVYFDAYSRPELESHFLGEHGKRLIRDISHRHTGVGSDGVILVCRPTAPPNSGARADVRMRMFNADGSESEMCGNGVRCVAKFAHDRLLINAQPMFVQTGRGVLSIEYRTHAGVLAEATVDMGEPILDLPRIPVLASHLAWSRNASHGVESAEGTWAATFVSMGNPHAVVFQHAAEAFTLDQLRFLELFRVGPSLEHHPAFPNRMNIHVVAVQSPTEATMRTWERGAGLTQACGTGACAVLVAGVLTGRLQRHALLHLPGGDLSIRWDETSNHVLMTGPAEDVFEGDWPDE